MTQQRVQACVDGANLRGALHLMQKRIDAGRFRQWVSRYGYPRIDWFQGAYPGTAPFFNHLRAQNIKVHAREPKLLPDGRRKADMDVEIAVVAMQLLAEFDILILVSGDGDFEPLLREMSETSGKRVIVMARRDMMDPALLQHVEPHDFIDLARVISEFGFDAAREAS